MTSSNYGVSEQFSHGKSRTQVFQFSKSLVPFEKLSWFRCWLWLCKVLQSKRPLKFWYPPNAPLWTELTGVGRSPLSPNCLNRIHSARSSGVVFFFFCLHILVRLTAATRRRPGVLCFGAAPQGNWSVSGHLRFNFSECVNQWIDKENRKIHLSGWRARKSNIKSAKSEYWESNDGERKKLERCKSYSILKTHILTGTLSPRPSPRTYTPQVTNPHAASVKPTSSSVSSLKTAPAEYDQWWGKPVRYKARERKK